MWPHLVKAAKADGVPALPKIFPVALGKVHVAGTWPGCPDASETLSWGPQVLTWKIGRIVPLCSACTYRKEWDGSYENYWDKTLSITDWSISRSKPAAYLSPGCTVSLWNHSRWVCARKEGLHLPDSPGQGWSIPIIWESKLNIKSTRRLSCKLDVRVPTAVTLDGLRPFQAVVLCFLAGSRLQGYSNKKGCKPAATRKVMLAPHLAPGCRRSRTMDQLGEWITFFPLN